MIALSETVEELKLWTRLRLAEAWRRSFDKTVFVGITGSHGKTTATAHLAEMLTTLGPTYVGIGRRKQTKRIAKGVLGASPRRCRYFVQEVSGHAPGALDDCIRVLQPTVGIVTAIGGDHRKSFSGERQAIAAEKAKLVHSLPAEGIAVLNADDPLVAQMADGCRCRVATFGQAEGADLQVVAANSNWPGRLTFEAVYRGQHFDVATQLVGKHWTLSVSAALLTALELGARRSSCLDVIRNQKPIFNRMSVHPAPNGAWFFMDAQKASFQAVDACIDFVETASAPRKTVIVGSLADYPGAARPHYQKVARLALDIADRVIFTGRNAQRVRRLTQQYPDRLLIVDEARDVKEMLSSDAIPGELIYVKSSGAEMLHQLFVPPDQR